MNDGSPEREPIVMKGFAKPVRTYAVTGLYDAHAGEGRLIHREDAGYSITIDRDRLTPKARAGLARELRSVLSDLEE